MIQKMRQVLEIHKYKGDVFMYIVARTTKHPEEYVKNDVEKMNDMLLPEMKAEGIRYVFALGTVDSMAKKKTSERSARKAKDKQNTKENNSPPTAIVNS
jgi:hypothetical protein